MNSFSFFKSLFTPFKPFKLKFYFGKVSKGTPYFYPRKWKKFTKKDAYNKAVEECNNPKLIYYGKDPNEVMKQFMNYQKAVTKKIGFDFVGLGWKTKWDDADFRFEHGPIWSFVFFKWQFAIMFSVPETSHYWEAWLYYELMTDKSISKEERIRQCIKEFPLTYTVSTTGSAESKKVNYYKNILKDKYLKYAD